MTPDESAEPTLMPNITQEMYASLPTGELVLFAVQHLHADGVPATLEEIVSTCFKLFPHRFSLKNYFYWPDSAHVTQALKYAREKGHVKDTPTEGFILRPAGRQMARQAAKAMGIRFPMPPKVEKKTRDDGPQKVVIPEPPKKAAAPAKKKKQARKVGKKAKPKQKPKQTKPAKKTVTKQKPTVEKAGTPARKKSASKVTAQSQKPVSKPVTTTSLKGEKKAPIRKKEKAPAKPAVKKPQAAKQLPLPAPAVPKKEAKPVVRKKPAKKKIQPKVKKEAKAAAAKAPVVSREEKVKAGKVVRLMERSDVYRQYRRNGKHSKISEFDFRNMLFATMESSAETLRRNLELFKRYAGIHNRADLIDFLEFCEGRSAHLLKPQAKPAMQKR